MNIRNPYTKNSLANDLKITCKRLTKELSKLEYEILTRFPYYNKNCQILGRRIYKFLLQEIGELEETEVSKIMAHKFTQDINPNN